jgi:uncharacterized protein YcbK (DUF882 family)
MRRRRVSLDGRSRRRRVRLDGKSCPKRCTGLSAILPYNEEIGMRCGNPHSPIPFRFLIAPGGLPLRHRTLLAIAALTFASVLASFVPAARAQEPDDAAKPTVLTNAPAAAPAPATPAPTIQKPSMQEPPAPSSEAQKPDAQGGDDNASVQGPSAEANDPDFRTAVAAAIPLVPAAYATQPYRLRLHNLHTLEDIDIVYRVGDNYQPDAVALLNFFLRDHNTNEVKAYDPREFDLLHDILMHLRRPDTLIDVVCGYRTQETNEILRASSRGGVAEHSQHILGHAIDIRIPGSTTVQIRNAALSLNEGGVGYYPTTHFVHVDVGAIRTWTYSPRRSHRRRRSHLRRVSAHHRQIAQHHHKTTRASGE